MIAETLIQEGHRVFFDRDSLTAGKPFDATIRAGIDNCDLFIFLISRNSLRQGSYAITELKLARNKWPTPKGEVLAVKIGEFDEAELPAYLSKISYVRPEGDVSADVAAIVSGIGSKSQPRTSGRRMILGAIAAATVATLGFTLWPRPEGKPAELTIDPKIIIGHNLGVPYLSATIRLRNPTSGNVIVKDIRVGLIDPQNKSTTMTMEGIFNGAQLLPALTSLETKPGEDVFFPYSLFNTVPEFQTLHNQVQTFMVQNAVMFNVNAPDIERSILPGDITERLRTFAESQFIWSAGTWKIEISGWIDSGRELKTTYRFEITEDEVRRMKWNMESYASGVGVFPPWRFLPMGGAQPCLEKSITR